MAYPEFVIPQQLQELLTNAGNNYCVQRVLNIKDIKTNLVDARTSLNTEGPDYIFQYFDTYFSILQNGDTLETHFIIQAFTDLNKAVCKLQDNIPFILNDRDMINDELQMKIIVLIKMLLYIYVEFVKFIQDKIENKKAANIEAKLSKGRKKTELDEEFVGFDRKSVLLNLNSIIQQEISVFWDPPLVEESLTNIIASICYLFLANSGICSDQEMRVEMFHVLGTLVKCYNHGPSFIVRMVYLVKTHEHLATCIPEGIKILVESYNCKSLVHSFIQELIESQSNEQFQDNQGAKYCSAVLKEMATVMPALMMPEIDNLCDYLYIDSVPLRNSILTIITEVILVVLTGHDLTEEEQNLRDGFFDVLLDHICDSSAIVRSKVFQHWARLQVQNAIPKKLQHIILKKAITHLRDKGALVRKFAAVCISEFLAHNIYAAYLQLHLTESELLEKKRELNTLTKQLQETQVDKLKVKEREWTEKLADIRKVIEEQLANSDDDVSQIEISKNKASYLIRMYIDENKYEDALKLLLATIDKTDDWKEQRKMIKEREQEIDFFITLLRVIYMDIRTTLSHDEEAVKDLQALENAVEFYEEKVSFIRMLHNAFDVMKELLRSKNVTDSYEAINFFSAAFQFKLDGAEEAALEMLQLMGMDDQNRKDALLDAFKKMYLKTDADNIVGHSRIIAERFITLTKQITADNEENLELLISEMAVKNQLDNSVIDVLWQYFTKKVEVSDDDARCALRILSMASLERKTILKRNVKLVATIAFSTRGKQDLLLVAEGCDALASLASDRSNVIDGDDVIWKDLFDILYENFQKPVPFFGKVIRSSINFLFKMCSSPQKICEQFLQRLFPNLREMQQSLEEGKLDIMIVSRIVMLFGEIALRLMQFLDEVVYNELNKRHYLREEKKTGQQNTSVIDKRKNISANLRKRSLVNASITTAPAEEDMMLGPQAEDMNADFIVHVMEAQIVTGKNILAAWAPMIKQICIQRVYQYESLQSISVISLMRFMLVSSKLCQENMKLIFNILEQTPYTQVKSIIVMHCADIVERFPNVIEPFTPKLFACLQNEDIILRRNTFFFLSNLVLQDFILVKGNISDMARCITDGDIELSTMSKEFFSQLAEKVNGLYSLLPDIFSQLYNSQDTIDEQDLRKIMKFLFNLISKTKHMENLVDRFCSKFRLTDDPKLCSNIAYCLTLITYNEKALSKLLDNFKLYRLCLQNDNVYTMFKQILNDINRSGKPPLKAIATEIEQQIESVLEVNEGGAAANNVPKSAKKSASKRSQKKRTKVVGSDDSEDEEVENEMSVSSKIIEESQRSTRSRRRK